MGTGQGVGSLLITDLQMYGGRTGISTSLHADNSTALLIMNSAFWFVERIVVDADKPAVLLPGATGEKKVDGWGFGRVSSPKGDVSFLNGATLATGKRHPSLVQRSTARQDFFTRRRPKYNQISFSQVIDAKEYGARGDGKSDDTAILNHLFSAAQTCLPLSTCPSACTSSPTRSRSPSGRASSVRRGHRSWPPA
jgi:hypothetical protein